MIFKNVLFYSVLTITFREELFCFVFFFFEISSHYVVQAGLELTMVSNLQQSSEMKLFSFDKKSKLELRVF